MKCCDGGCPPQIKHQFITFDGETECPMCELILKFNAKIDSFSDAILKEKLTQVRNLHPFEQLK